LQEIQTQVASLFPPAGDADRFSDAHFDLAQEPPLSPPHLPGVWSLESGAWSLEPGVWSLDLYHLSRVGFRHLWLDQCFYLRCFLWRGSSPEYENLSPHGSMQQNACGAYAVLIHKPPDRPSSATPSGQSSAVLLRPLNLAEIFYHLTARAAVRVESPAVGNAIEPLQLGVGIPSGWSERGPVCFRRATSVGGLRLE
jgi:hypothetical protein